MYIEQKCKVVDNKLAPIETIEQLHHHLQLAIELEFSTVPPYLTALYSIKEGSNINAASVIRSVVMEEMFHLTNAANVLIGVGGKPALNQQAFLPTYPTYLPDNEHWFKVGLLPFSREALQGFLSIELPGEKADGVITIGEFYENIQQGLAYLDHHTDGGIFVNNPQCQIAHKYYYGGGGIIKPVIDIETAQFAINAIIAQGEGAPTEQWDPDKPFELNDTTGISSGDHELFQQPRELAHYYRFNELFVGRRYIKGDSHNSGPTGPKLTIDFAAVYNMKPNPVAADVADTPHLDQLSNGFITLFSKLLDQLHQAFNGEPDILVPAVTTMFSLKESALQLIRNPLPYSPENYHAGPCWVYRACGQ